MGLKESREKAGYSVLEASRLLCVSPAAIYQWEYGWHTPNSKRLPQIAKLYGVTVDELLKENTQNNERR